MELTPNTSPREANSPGDTQQRAGAAKSKATIRASLACVPCRSKHVKCDSALPTCLRCRLEEKTCYYAKSRRGIRDAKKRSLINDPIAPPSISPDTPVSFPSPEVASFDIPINVVDKLPCGWSLARSSHLPDLNIASPTSFLFDLYFTNFHDTHPWLLPRNQLLSRIRSNPEPFHFLTSCITYVGSLFSNAVSPAELREKAFSLASGSLPMTCWTVQGLLVLSVATFGEGRLDLSAGWMDAATQMALDLGMQDKSFADAASDPFVAESSRRTYWALYWQGNMRAMREDSPTFMLCSVFATTELPCEEWEYQSGEIPQPLSLKKYNARDPMDEKSYSSWTYLIDLCRLSTELILPMPTLPPALLSNTIDRADSRLVSWLINLPKWKQRLVDSGGAVDMVLFHAMAYAHSLRIKMQLPMEASGFGMRDLLTLGPLFKPRDMTFPRMPRCSSSPYPWLECSTALQAGLSTIGLFNFSLPPSRYSPACIIGLRRAALALLDARMYGGSDSPALREKLDLLLGVLKVAGEMWPIARSIGNELDSCMDAFITDMSTSGVAPDSGMFPFPEPRTVEDMFNWSAGIMNMGFEQRPCSSNAPLRYPAMDGPLRQCPATAIRGPGSKFPTASSCLTPPSRIREISLSTTTPPNFLWDRNDCGIDSLVAHQEDRNMSFAIEVPGDANPLSLQELCRVLESATSADYARRQAAGQQLTSWETEKGYFSSLQTVFLDKSLPHELRFLAVIQLKNGIDKYWRLLPHVKGGLDPEEKNVVRQRLFQGTLEEEETGLSLHNSLVTAKVIRIDYPQHWPEALSQIIGLVRSSKNGNQQHLYGALQILLRVVKELGTARLRRSQTALQSVTPEMVYLLGEIYTEKSAVWIDYLTSGRGEEDVADVAMLNSLISLKTIRRLLVVGYEAPHNDKTVEQFWTVSQNHFGQFLGFVSHDSPVPAPYQDTVGKHLLQFTKLHIDMSEAHPASFAVLPNSLPLVHAYWDLVAKFAEVFEKSGGIRQSSGDSGPSESKSKVEGPLLERLALRGLLLMRACLRIAFYPKQTFKFRSAEAKKDENDAVALIKQELLKDDFVVQMANIIITHLFVFRKADLDAWEEDPEEWEQQEQSEGNAYEWEVRPCAEKLFLDLLVNFKDLMIPPLLSYFQTASNSQSDIATKEAVYTAMGLAAPNVMNAFDFDSLLVSTVLQDAQQQGPLYKVLRRRIAIMVSQWVTVKIADNSRPLIYEMFRHFLNPADPNNDIVVRITAARQLRWIVDELAFSAEAFLPYAADVLNELLQLIQNVDVDETKLAVLESMRILVTRLENYVSQFADFIMSSLPSIWENSGTEEYMIKQAIIAIFAALVMSMGSDSQRYHHLMVPLLSEAAKPGSDLHTYLIDEALELWNSVLMQSNPPLSADIMSIAELSLPLLEYQTETAAQALSVVESYILLGTQAVMEDRLRRPFLIALSGVLDSRSREQVRLGTVCIEYLIRAASELGGTQVIMQDLLEIGFLKKIMEALHDAWEAHQTTGPNRKVSKLNTITERDYFALLSRLLIADPTLFVTMLTSFGPLEQLWAWLSGEWFSHLDGLDHLPRQKLSLLALARLLELPQPMQNLTLSKLQDYFTLWVSTIAELQDGTTDGTDSLIWGELEPTDYDTPKSIKETEFGAKDPVHTINAMRFVKERLQDVVQRSGGEQQFEQEWAANVDKDILQKFWSLTQITGA
ncbi:importin-beta domain-containing protein [Colletotrichum salicis]|uniref:Importin-beta domain-containing protein n=1 Tax=Colletotrichum salicis TaxID=1209931 RepID=A0A135U0V9_9PEZI|nr:importin-beta domain-containing protein [Colletotrichum salicis]